MLPIPVLLAFAAAVSPVIPNNQKSGAEAAPALILARDLLSRCTARNVGPDYCYGYVAAVYDSVRAYEAWLHISDICTSGPVTQSELVKAVVSHLRAHPRDLDSQAASVVVVALQAVYPCVPASPASKRSSGK